MNQPRTQFAILILLNVIWTPVNLAITEAIQYASPLMVALMRWTFLGLLMAGLLQIGKVRELVAQKLPTMRDAIYCILCGFLFAGPSHAIYYWALQHTGTVETTVINTTGPFWIALFAISILGEKISGLRWLAIIGGLIGAYVVAIGFGLPQMKSSHTMGNMAYLAGIMLESLSFVAVTRVVRRSSGAGAFAWEILGMFLAMFAIHLIFPKQMPLTLTHVGPGFIGAMAYLVIGAGLFAWAAWYVIAERAPVSFMIVTLGVQAPLAALVGWLFLSEQVGSQLIVGSLLILGSLGVAAWEGARREERGETTGIEVAAAPEPS